jgi:N-terminal half of MaoC dehydratase
MFDTSKIGQSFAPFTIEVQRCKIHELTSAIGDDNPVYHNREAAQAAGFPDVPISPTTPTLFNFWGSRQEGFNLAVSFCCSGRHSAIDPTAKQVDLFSRPGFITGHATFVEGLENTLGMGAHVLVVP